MNGTKKRYLIITEKPSVAKCLRDVYAKMGTAVNFEADIVPANNHVVNTNNNMLVNKYNRANIVTLPILRLKNRPVDENFRVDADGMWAGFGRRIADLISKNQYDAIVNACDDDEEGELEFQYVIESMGLEKCETKRLAMNSYFEADLMNALMRLNDD